MTPATIIEEAKTDGVALALSAAGAIKVTGEGVAVDRWLPTIREYKAGILEALRAGAPVVAKPLAPPTRRPSAHMSIEDEATIRAWLALIGETDPATIAEVIGQCQRDADARGYFTGRAAAELPRLDATHDGCPAFNR